MPHSPHDELEMAIDHSSFTEFAVDRQMGRFRIRHKKTGQAWDLFFSPVLKCGHNASGPCGGYHGD